MTVNFWRKIFVDFIKAIFQLLLQVVGVFKSSINEIFVPISTNFQECVSLFSLHYRRYLCLRRMHRVFQQVPDPLLRKHLSLTQIEAESFRCLIVHLPGASLYQLLGKRRMGDLQRCSPLVILVFTFTPRSSI